MRRPTDTAAHSASQDVLQIYTDNQKYMSTLQVGGNLRAFGWGPGAEALFVRVVVDPAPVSCYLRKVRKNAAVRVPEV